MTEIYCNIEAITPELAQRYLELNSRQQRKIRRHKVAEYADDMRNGLWELNGAAIVIDEFGNLIDGQHRLSAVVESGTTQQFVVVRNVREDAYRTIDQGMKRSLADASNFNTVECAIGKAMASFEYAPSIQAALRSRNATNAAAIEYMNANAGLVKTLANEYRKLRACVGRLSTIAVAVSFCAISEAYGRAAALSFFGEMQLAYEEGSSVYARKFARYMADTTGDTRATREKAVRLTLYIFDKWALAQPVLTNASSRMKLELWDAKCGKGE